MVGGFLIRRKALSIFSSINSGAVLMTVAYVLLNVFVDLTSSEDASASSGRGLAVLQVCLVIMGLGVGLTFNATSSFVMDVAPENLLANVFGVIRMAQQVFILLGYIVAEAIIGDKPSEESNPGRYVTTARVMLAMNALYCMYPAWSCGFVQGRKEEATKSRKIDAAQTATTPGR
uniref:Uncharacterized protein n=1 Tax=Pinguiococcus pyrenoidosus TaxID=172671 RepID=A0A7R9Y9D8_9STRA